MPGHIRRAGIEDFPMPALGVVQFELLRVANGKAAVVQQICSQADDVAKVIQIRRIRNLALHHTALWCLADAVKQRRVVHDLAILCVGEWQRPVHPIRCFQIMRGTH